MYRLIEGNWLYIVLLPFFSLVLKWILLQSKKNSHSSCILTAGVENFGKLVRFSGYIHSISLPLNRRSTWLKGSGEADWLEQKHSLNCVKFFLSLAKDECMEKPPQPSPEFTSVTASHPPIYVRQLLLIFGRQSSMITFFWRQITPLTI